VTAMSAILMCDPAAVFSAIEVSAFVKETAVGASFAIVAPATGLSANLSISMLDSVSVPSGDLTGSTNANHLAAGAGNDILRGSPGGDTLDGGEGTDTVDYSANGYGVRINLGAGTASQLEAGGGVASNDTLVSIENAIGTAYDDTLAGVSGSVLKAGAGNDSLVFGGSALSMFDGGAGTDAADFSNAGSAIWSDLSRYTASTRATRPS